MLKSKRRRQQEALDYNRFNRESELRKKVVNLEFKVNRLKEQIDDAELIIKHHIGNSCKSVKEYFKKYKEVT